VQTLITKENIETFTVSLLQRIILFQFLEKVDKVY